MRPVDETEGIGFRRTQHARIQDKGLSAFSDGRLSDGTFISLVHLALLDRPPALPRKKSPAS
jgi:hypothetical protein